MKDTSEFLVGHWYKYSDKLYGQYIVKLKRIVPSWQMAWPKGDGYIFECFGIVKTSPNGRLTGYSRSKSSLCDELHRMQYEKLDVNLQYMGLFT